MGEEGEAFKQVLVVIVLDHRRSVSLKQKSRGVMKPCGNMINQGGSGGFVPGGNDAVSNTVASTDATCLDKNDTFSPKHLEIKNYRCSR